MCPWTCFSFASENAFGYVNENAFGCASENAVAWNVSFFDGVPAPVFDVKIESYGNETVSLNANACGLSTASASYLEMGNYCSNRVILNASGLLTDSAFDRQIETVFVLASVIAYVVVIEIAFVHETVNSFYPAIETSFDQAACEVLDDFVSVFEDAHASGVVIEIDCDVEIEAVSAVGNVSCYEI